MFAEAATSGVVDVFLSQGVLGAVCLALGGAVVYQNRQLAQAREDAKAEREAARIALAASEQGRLSEAQARVADAKEIRVFMTEFQKGEAAALQNIENIADNLIRITERSRP